MNHFYQISVVKNPPSSIHDKASIDTYLVEQSTNTFYDIRYCPVELFAIYDHVGAKLISRCYCGKYLDESGKHVN